MTLKEDKALLKAAEKGRLEAVKTALDAGADVNCCDAKGRTAVALSVMANSVSCTHEILTRGADPNIPDKNKEYPIHVAACFQATDVLRILVDSGSVNLESQNKDGNTALHKAAYAGCVDCVMYLTSKGADSKAQNNKYEIPAALARKKNHKGVLAVMKAAQLREKSGIQGRPVSQIIHADNGMPLEPVRFHEGEGEGAPSEAQPEAATPAAEEAPAAGGGPPPPPGGGPPPPPGGGPPPPPGGAPNLGSGGAAGGGVLGGIGSVKLKKREAPAENKPAASSGGGGGGGGVGGMMAEMIAKRNKMKEKAVTEGPSFTAPQLKQFEEDFMFLLKDDISSWKKDIVQSLAA